MPAILSKKCFFGSRFGCVSEFGSWSGIRIQVGWNDPHSKRSEGVGGFSLRFNLCLGALCGDLRLNIFLSVWLRKLRIFSIKPVLRIRDVYPWSDFFPSRIPIKEFKYFNPKKTKNKKWFLSSKNLIRVVHPGSGRDFLTIPDPDVTFYPSRIRMWLSTHPGSRGQKGTQSRIRNTVSNLDSDSPKLLKIGFNE